MNFTLLVDAHIRDEADHQDAAYDLCGEFTPLEFVAELAKVLGSDWNLTHATGDVTLTIQITKNKPWTSKTASAK